MATPSSEDWSFEDAPRKLSPFKSLTHKTDSLIVRFRWAIILVFVLFLVAAHYWILGFATWDGLSYRISPIVEFLQHGNLGGWKFNYPAAQYFAPFFELVHIPFLGIFGLNGLHFGFSLILLPLSAWAVFAFVRELTGDKRWATYGMLVFVAIPFVNAQPFAGYIDFAVIGALAFFLYVAIRALRTEHPGTKDLVFLSLGTFIFTMSRQQAPYIALLLAVILPLIFEPENQNQPSSTREKSPENLRLPTLLLYFVIGLAPAAAVHLSRLIEFGSPIYPYQFDVFGITTAVGLSSEYTTAGAGLADSSWEGLLSSFIRAWIWPGDWPGNFYDSRILGVGLLFLLFLLTLPIIVRRFNQEVAFLIAILILIAIVSRDFWLPRWSMTSILVMVVGVGGALSYAARRKSLFLYAPILFVVFAHFARPIYDVAAMTSLGLTYNRVNLAESTVFIGADEAPGELLVYPDLDADLLVVHPIINEFTLLLYGRNLTNEIVGVLEAEHVDTSCQVENPAKSNRRLLVVDQMGNLPGAYPQCNWICDVSIPNLCQAGTLTTLE